MSLLTDLSFLQRLFILRFYAQSSKNYPKKAFTGFYYPAFANDRSSLANVYTDQSCMTFEGAQFQGKAPILEKLMSLPFQKVNHQITTIDSQPIIGVDDNKVREFQLNFILSFKIQNISATF